jgi:succinate dehydrogenase / fumarate reductase flavoprotein subunit
MSESLRNDGRVWVPQNAVDCWDHGSSKVGRHPNQIPEGERDYYLERRYPTFGNLVPRDVASRAAKKACDQGRGIAYHGRGVYLDFADAMKRLGKSQVEARYGNLFEMYERITGDSPYEVPMRIYPASHYTMGGLWVDYNLMSNLPGLHVIGEANFSDHGANRLGASALMQGLADGYFVLPYTIGNYLWSERPEMPSTEAPEFVEAETRMREKNQNLLGIKGKRSVDYFHRSLGKIMWDKCGLARDEKGLTEAKKEIAELRDEFWNDVRVLGDEESYNVSLEKAGRVADFLEFGEIMCEDALGRRESCGCHFREESQTEDGEALRDDETFKYVAAWEFTGVGETPRLHKEDLEFENVKLTQRSYK